MMYTPEATLSADSVTYDKYSLYAEDTETEIRSACYYPGIGKVKLTVQATLASDDTLFNLTSTGLTDIDGEAADESLTVYLVKEDSVDYDTVGIEAYCFVKDGAPVLDISGKSGIMVNVRIANATGTVKQGKVRIYDGSVLCGEASYSIKNEGVEQITVDTSAHEFTGNENITIELI